MNAEVEEVEAWWSKARPRRCLKRSCFRRRRTTRATGLSVQREPHLRELVRGQRASGSDRRRHRASSWGRRAGAITACTRPASMSPMPSSPSAWPSAPCTTSAGARSRRGRRWSRGLRQRWATALVGRGRRGDRAPRSAKVAGADVPYWMIVVAIPLVVQFRLVETIVPRAGPLPGRQHRGRLIPVSRAIELPARGADGGLTVSGAIVIWSLSPLPRRSFGYGWWSARRMAQGSGAGAVSDNWSRFGMQGQLGNIVQP